MTNVARFEKVSLGRFIEDAQRLFPKMEDTCIVQAYKDVQLPRRGTKGSAGYDFVSPVDVVLQPGESVTLPTGIRTAIGEGWFLLLLPRSGMGFKYKMQLDNTAGVIDSDYYFAENEGHIMAKITNDSREGKTLTIAAGDRFMQGIFLPFGVTLGDDEQGERRGGFGSTGK